jgi:hypothetical protein
MACYGNVFDNSEDTWKSGLELYRGERTTLSSGSSSDVNNQHQVYAIIDDTSEEVDTNNNPIINPGNVRRGANHMEEGDTEETIAARARVQITPEEWDTKKRSPTGIPLRPTSASAAVGKGKKENQKKVRIS